LLFGKSESAGSLASAVSGHEQLSVVCDHVALAAAAAQSAGGLLQQHGPAVTHGVIDACHNALRSTTSAARFFHCLFYSP